MSSGCSTFAALDQPTASLREDIREELAREKAEKAEASNRGKASQKQLPISMNSGALSAKSGRLNGAASGLTNGHANGAPSRCIIDLSCWSSVS